MPQTRTGKQRAVNTRTRLRAAAVFLCLALIVVSAYFLLFHPLRFSRPGSGPDAGGDVYRTGTGGVSQSPDKQRGTGNRQGDS